MKRTLFTKLNINNVIKYTSTKQSSTLLKEWSNIRKMFSISHGNTTFGNRKKVGGY